MSDEDHESLCRRIAWIMGDGSAAALALRDLEARRANGQQAIVVNYCNTWFVVPKSEETARLREVCGL